VQRVLTNSMGYMRYKYGVFVVVAIVIFIALNLVFGGLWTTLYSSEPPDAAVTKELTEVLLSLHTELKELRDTKIRYTQGANSSSPTPRTGNVLSEPQSKREVIVNDPSVLSQKVEVDTPARVIPKRAVIFTMDSIASYEKNSLSGGAAGANFYKDFNSIYFLMCNVYINSFTRGTNCEEMFAKNIRAFGSKGDSFEVG
jgi:hypothetical protein